MNELPLSGIDTNDMRVEVVPLHLENMVVTIEGTTASGTFVTARFHRVKSDLKNGVRIVTIQGEFNSMRPQLALSRAPEYRLLIDAGLEIVDGEAYQIQVAKP